MKQLKSILLYKNKWVRISFIILVLVCIAGPLMIRHSTRNEGLEIESIHWDAEKLDSTIRFNNGKEITGIGDDYKLEVLQSFVATDDQQNQHHVFLFKRACDDCGEKETAEPDMLIYDYEAESSEAMALPGLIRNMDTSQIVSTDRIFVGTCPDPLGAPGSPWKIVDFWDDQQDVELGEVEHFSIEVLNFLAEGPALSKTEVQAQDFRAKLALLPMPGCKELVLP